MENNIITKEEQEYNKSNNNKSNQSSTEKIYSTTIDIKERENGEKMEYHKLFVDLSSEEWGEIFGIFMKLTNTTLCGESIYVKKKKIKEYCDEKGYDFLTALREIYLYIRGSYSFRWYNTETKEKGRDYFDKEKLRMYKKNFPEIIIYNETPDLERSMVEKEEQDIYHTMINILKERKENPEKYVNNVLQKIKFKAEYLSFFEKEFYILAKDIIFNKDTEVNKPTNDVITQVIQNPNDSKDDNIFEKEPYYQLFQQIINDNFNSKMLVTYISKILEDDYQILSLREEFNFFRGKSVESIVDNICESKKRYTDTQAKQISLVSNHLEIILAYFESDKQITPLFIEKVTLSRDKIPCLSTILDIITKNNSKKNKDVENNLSKVWMYNQLIDILEKLPLFQDKECIKQQNEMIDNYITKLNIEKKSIDVYQNDRENLINEIISDINAILDKPKKKNVIVEEESNTDIENNAKKSRETLKPKLSKDELTQVFNKLVEKKFISDDLELFLACFGFGEDNEKNITWKSSQVEFEIFVRELVQEEKNPVNKEMCLPRKKINCWFVDVRNKPIKPTPKNKISCGNESYQTYKIIHP